MVEEIEEVAQALRAQRVDLDGVKVHGHAPRLL
jgi:hypothetical protein